MIVQSKNSNRFSIHFSFTFMLVIIIVSTLCTSFPKCAYSISKSDSLKIVKLTDSTFLQSIPFNLAITNLDSARNIAIHSGDTFMLAQTYVRQGDLFYNYNKYYKAIENYKQAIPYYASHNSLINKYLEIILSISFSYSNMQVADSMLTYINIGLHLLQKKNNDFILLRYYDRLGYYYEIKENYAKALKYYYKALEIANKIKDYGGETRELLVIGIIYDNSGDTVNAIKYYNKALQIAKKHSIKDAIIAAMNNLTSISSDSTKDILAKEFKIFHLNNKAQDTLGMAMSLNNIAVSLNDLNRLDEAIKYYHKAYSLSREKNYKDVEILILNNLGLFYDDSTKYNNLDSAIYYFKKGVAFSKKNGTKQDEADFLYNLADAFSQNKDYKNAFLYSIAYEKADDSVNNLKKEKQFLKVKTKFEALRYQNEFLKANYLVKRFRYIFVIILLVSTLLIITLTAIFVHRKLKDKKLRQRKQFADALLENDMSYLFIFSDNGHVFYLSPSLQNDFNYNSNEVNVKYLFDKINSQDIKSFNNIIDDVKNGNLPVAMFECEVTNKNGEYHYVTGKVINLKKNHVLKGILINAWDITKQRKSEQLLENSMKKFKSIFEAFPDIYMCENNESIITTVSPSVFKISGYRPEELIGKPVSLFYKNQSERKLARKILFENSEIIDHTITLIGKNGKSIISSLTAKLTINETGHITGVEAVVRDITERAKQQELLKEANETKDKLFSIIAHDLVGPIGMQKNMIDLLIANIKTMSKKEIIPFVASMKPALDATMFMMENLLSWARIMRQNLKPRIINANIYELVEEIFDFLKPQANAKNIKLLFKGDKKLNAYFDKNMMIIVIRNLIANAIKFSHEDSKVIVSTELNGEKVKVSVHDTGIGIPKEILDKLNSEKHKSQTRLGTNNEKGTGIGLVIVKEFLIMQNSRLFIKSETNKGSRFSFTLPH